MFKLVRTFIVGLRDLYLIKFKFRRYNFGKNFHAGRGLNLWAKNFINIGDNFYIGRYSQIECDATIGDNVIMGNYVGLIGRYDHKYDDIETPIRLASQIRDHDYSWHGMNSSITIKNGVWVGYGSVLLSGITIGENAIIAAGSVVTKYVKPYEIVGGNPAKHIKFRFTEEEIEHYELSVSRNKQ